MAKDKTAKKDKKENFDISTSNLASRYRPKVLEDYVGQDAVVTEIKGFLKTKKFPSTLLIEGPTGTGKTTLARILARYINCETLNACGECFSCKFSESHPDVHELNMGEHGKVDQVRAMIQSANNAPMTRRRLFILDEAHLMTQQAASALLVPVENPPSRTMWIFCTTNPEKLLDTMLGRCVRLKLGFVEQDVMVKRLAKISKKEGVNFKEDIKGGKDILRLISDFSNGHMRNAISLLDSVIGAFNSGEKLDLKTVLSKYVTTSDVDLERTAVSTLCAVLNSDLDSTIRFIIKSENARGLMHKMRWLVDFLIREQTKTAKYTPYSGRLFHEVVKKQGIRWTLASLISIQYLLVEAETKFNSLNIDENVLLQTILGDYVIKRLQYIAKKKEKS